MALLSVSGLTKHYRGGILALDDVSFELDRGQVLALLGANVAGKSTLIKCLVGLIGFEGSVTVDGCAVTRGQRDARARIGYLAQQPAFHPDLTVEETAVFYADLRGTARTEAHERVASVGLEEHAGKLVSALSGGMKQRLALSIALLGDPPLLVLDEPAAGLDIAARLELRALVEAQRSRGVAVLLSTHWLEDVPYVADQALVLAHGRQQFLGPADMLSGSADARSRLFLRLAGAQQEAVRIVRSLLPWSETATKGDWLVVLCRPAEKARVVEALVRAHLAILDLRVEEASMDLQQLADGISRDDDEGAQSCA